MFFKVCHKTERNLIQTSLQYASPDREYTVRGPRFLLASYLHGSTTPMPSACIGSLYLFQRQKKDLERCKKGEVIAESEGVHGEAEKDDSKKRGSLSLYSP